AAARFGCRFVPEPKMIRRMTRPSCYGTISGQNLNRTFQTRGMMMWTASPAEDIAYMRVALDEARSAAAAGAVAIGATIGLGRARVFGGIFANAAREGTSDLMNGNILRGKNGTVARRLLRSCRRWGRGSVGKRGRVGGRRAGGLNEGGWPRGRRRGIGNAVYGK